ncbi:MAG: alpha/beta hydrolase [Bacteroidetes bacterium]|nr:alpha/beta hydrolase [Bacteroidota bacterium]HAO05737.1 hypothetical protein [Chryseobacterium sp.]
MKNIKISILFVILIWASTQIVNAQGSAFYDLPYAQDTLYKHKLDLYIPDSENFPTILFIHGGSLIDGDRKDSILQKMASQFTVNGVAVALISYRLSPAKWPSQANDVASAFSYLKKTIASYGGNPLKIFIMGHSSGALLAANVSTDSTTFSRYKLSLQDIAGFISIGSMMKHIAPTQGWPKEKIESAFKTDAYFSIFSDKNTFDNVSPYLHINKMMPKGLLIIAEDEQVNPPILEQSIEFVEKSFKHGVDVKYKVIPNRTHMSNIIKISEKNDPLFNLIVEFTTNKTEKNRK